MSNMRSAFFQYAKYVFSLAATICAYFCVENMQFLIVALAELLLIFIISNNIINIKTGKILNSIVLFLYNVQIAVLIFANSYITLVMLTNLHAIEMLSGKIAIYAFAVAVVIFFSFLPVKQVVFSSKTNKLFLGNAIGIYLCALLICGNVYSPLYNYFDLGIQQYETIRLTKQLSASMGDKEATKLHNTLYNIEVRDCYVKDFHLVEQPNIILIFTEGLSQNIISDERNIMPNVAEYQSRSLNFTNYYNHTFATYRGLIGQLYSGHQKNDFDHNALISIQDILNENGYHTIFLNSEPRNTEFTNY